MLDFIINSIMFHVILSGCISLSSFLDKPGRFDGNIRNDIPSTIGVVAGFLMVLYYLPLYSVALGFTKLYLYYLYKDYQKNLKDQAEEVEFKED